MKDWQIVYKSENSPRAEIVKAILEDKGLNPVMISKKDSNYHFGVFEVYVSPDNVIPSLQIIQTEIKFD